MTTTRHHVLEGPEVWLGVQEASDMLGVSTATLRRWSAAGLVRAFTTPGGHRRYAESTIRQLLAQGRGPERTTSSLGESADRVARLVRRRLAPLCSGLSWLPELPPEQRGRFGEAGRAMIDGLLGYVDGQTEAACEAAIGPACEAAALHGRVAARYQGNLGETLEAFHRFRGLLLDDLAELACNLGLATAEATHILARASDGVDRLIVALVDAHAEERQAAGAG